MTRPMMGTTSNTSNLPDRPPGMTDLLLTNIQLQTDLTERLFATMSNAYLPPHPSARHRNPRHLAASSSGQPQTIAQIHAALQAASEEQALLLERARSHQEKWDKLRRKRERVDRLEGKVREVLMTLEAGRKELEALIDEGRDTVKAIDLASVSKATAPEIIRYATHLAPYTSRLLPPPNPASILPAKLTFTAQQASELAPTTASPHNFVYPVELIIRHGRLAAAASQAGIGMLGGLGDVGVVGEGEKALNVGQGMLVDDEGFGIEDPLLPPSALEQPAQSGIHPSLPPEPSRPAVPARPFKLGLEDSDDEDD